MKYIGGEIELDRGDIEFAWTDSGRSSLRLILLSKPDIKKLAIPDYLCGVIIDTIDSMGISWETYRILSDLSIDGESLCVDDYDAVYVVNFFGQQDKLLKTNFFKNALVIQDAVFEPEFKKPEQIDNWCGFNSLRKIVPVADGSMVKATFQLRHDVIKSNVASYVTQRYDAKYLRFKFLSKGEGGELEYLDMFNKANNIQYQQKTIHLPSFESLSRAFEFGLNSNKEQKIRCSNYSVLKNLLGKWIVPLSPEFFSYALLKLRPRDRVRKYLMNDNIFLPVHWPVSHGLENRLYSSMISIPIDSRYGGDDMERVAKLIMKYSRM